MSQLAIILIYAWIAGATAFAGGILAWLEGSAETEGKQEIVHSVVAFGGGILIAAIAFTLVPEGLSLLSPTILAITFCAGGIVFCVLDYCSTCHTIKKSNKAQFMAMLLDFIPEAIALGAIFGYDHNLGILLALFIGAQNLPEGFNSFREMKNNGAKTKHILRVLFAISFLGPISACLGYFLLQNHKALTAGIMIFAAGGILYLIFQDIAPESTMKKHRTPPLGAVLGFAVGMIGKQILIG